MGAGLVSMSKYVCMFARVGSYKDVKCMSVKTQLQTTACRLHKEYKQAGPLALSPDKEVLFCCALSLFIHVMLGHDTLSHEIAFEIVMLTLNIVLPHIQ